MTQIAVIPPSYLISPIDNVRIFNQMLYVVCLSTGRTGQPSQVQLEPQLHWPEAQPQFPFMLIVWDCFVERVFERRGLEVYWVWLFVMK